MNALTSQGGALATVPDYIRQLQVPGRKRMHDQLTENLGAGSVPYISIAGGAFTAKGGAIDRRVGQFDPQAGVYLDCMIIDQLEFKSRIFYTEDWNPGQQDFKPPACFSHNGSGPSTQCSEPQAPTCAACPNSVWGSAVSGATGKGVPACSEYQYIAVELPGDPQIWLMRVPPASLKNLKAYNKVFENFDQDIPDVITRIWFEAGKQGSLLFAAVGYPPQEMVQYRNQVWHEKKCDVVLSRSDRARDPAAFVGVVAPVQAPMSPAPQQTYTPAAPMPGQPGYQYPQQQQPQNMQPQAVAPGYPGGGPAAQSGFPQGPSPQGPAPFAGTQSMPGGAPQQGATSGPSVQPAAPGKKTRKTRVVQPAAPQQNGQVQAPFMQQPQPAPQAPQNQPHPGYAPGPAPGYPGAAPGPGYAAPGPGQGGQVQGMPQGQGGTGMPGAGQQFGIAPATAPNADVQNAINSVIPR